MRLCDSRERDIRCEQHLPRPLMIIPLYRTSVRCDCSICAGRPVTPDDQYFREILHNAKKELTEWLWVDTSARVLPPHLGAITRNNHKSIVLDGERFKRLSKMPHDSEDGVLPDEVRTNRR
jgi:hypothetical protein